MLWGFGIVSSAVICRADIARQFRDDYVVVKGIGLAVTSGRPWFDAKNECVGFESTRAASEAARWRRCRRGGRCLHGRDSGRGRQRHPTTRRNPDACRSPRERAR